jgi:hypothetical protein
VVSSCVGTVLWCGRVVSNCVGTVLWVEKWSVVVWVLCFGVEGW